MRLLIVTQVVDPKHPVLGFFVEWLGAFAKHPKIEGVDVISFDGGNTTVPGCTIHRIQETSRFRRVMAFRRTISSLHPDAVFVHMTPVWLLAGLDIWKRQHAKTSLWYTHGSNSLPLQLAVRFGDKTFTATKNAFPIVSSRVHAIGHAISDSYASVQRTPSADGLLRCLTVARIMPRKRILETVDFFKRIHDIEPTSTLDLVGPTLGLSEYVQSVREKIDLLNLTDAIRIVEDRHIADMSSVYGSHDLLLHLSDTGSLDKVVLESLASGCPVFSTNRATKEALAGTSWYHDGALDDSAASHAIEMARVGVKDAERQKIIHDFALDRLIQNIVDLL